jgi:hypothetical protein
VVRATIDVGAGAEGVSGPRADPRGITDPTRSRDEADRFLALENRGGRADDRYAVRRRQASGAEVPRRVRAVVDGFGTAYSSLPHLGRFHVDSPNVDRSLVSRLGVKPEDAAIVSAIISLAHTLGRG